MESFQKLMESRGRRGNFRNLVETYGISVGNLPISGWGFILFLVSSVSWTVAGMMMREHSLILLNAVFTVINVLGIYRWLIA